MSQLSENLRKALKADMAEVVVRALRIARTHYGSATQFCAHPDCRGWDGDTYQNPDGSGSQPEGYLERHQEQMVLKEMGLL